MLRFSARFLFVIGVAVSGCFPQGDPLVLGPVAYSGVARLEEHRFGILVFPCAREPVTSFDLYLKEFESDEVVPVLRETFASPVPADELLVTTGADDPPSVEGAKRKVLNAELLEQFNFDETFAIGEVKIRPLYYFDVQALGPSGKDLAGSISVGSALRFDLEVGKVAIDSFAPSEPIESFSCRDGLPAWNVVLP